MFAWEGATGLIGVDDDGGIGQRLPRQVMVGNDDVDAELVCRLDACNTGNAVVDGDDDVGDFSRAVSATISGVSP